MRLSGLLVASIVGLCACLGPDAARAPRFAVLVFSKTAAYRHASIPNGISLIQELGATNQFAVDATEDASRFNDATLARYQAVVFLNTTGDVLDTLEQAALRRYVERGGGFVGIHSASDTEHGWAWYGALVGAYFQSHPAIQAATIHVEDSSHPSTVFLPATWQRTDEWYNFATNPRASVHVLATIAETSYVGGTMGADHPIAWCQLYDGGRSWYTESGHTATTYGEALYQRHVLGGILWAAGIVSGNCR